LQIIDVKIQNSLKTKRNACETLATED